MGLIVLSGVLLKIILFLTLALPNFSSRCGRILCGEILPRRKYNFIKYSGGQVIKIIKSIAAKAIFKEVPIIKRELWGGEFWTDGYYIATISGKGNKKVIEQYIINQGREQDIKQLRLFEL